jgi:hypothetical protein
LPYVNNEFEQLQELYAAAAYPELYSVLLQQGAVPSILGMVTHENTVSR